MVTVGLEIEGWGYDTHEEPIDVLDEVKNNQKLQNLGYKGNGFTSDAGYNQLELASSVFDRPEHAIDELYYMKGQSPAHWRFVFAPHHPHEPFSRNLKWANKPRYNALIQALEKEAKLCDLGDEWQGVYVMPACCATHITFGINPWSPEGTMVMNVLGNAAPYIAAQSAKRFSIDNRGHLSIWRFVREQRLPHYHWFDSNNELLEYFCSIPCLLNVEGSNGNTVWNVGLDQCQSIDDDVALGTTWWFARPKKEALEFRALPSMPFEDVREIACELYSAVEIILDSVSGNETCITGAWPLFKKLSTYSSLFPPRPLSKMEWTNLFLR